jgi:hypothetical protein
MGILLYMGVTQSAGQFHQGLFQGEDNLFLMLAVFKYKPGRVTVIPPG